MEFTGERVVPGKVPIDLFHEHMVRYLFAENCLKYGQRVLDAGCGTGYGTAVLAEHPGVEVVGVDVSDEAVAYATANYGCDNCTFVAADLLEMPFAEGLFDSVVSFEVIEHLTAPKEFVKAVKEVLRPDGVFILSTPNRRMYSDSSPGYKNPYHVKEYYYKEFLEMLKNEFSNVQVYAQDFVQGMAVRPLQSNEEDGHALFRPLMENSEPENDASFFVAVCSESSLQVHPTYVVPFTSSNILAEKDRYIFALKEEIKKRDEATFALKSELEVTSSWVRSLHEEVEKRDAGTTILQREMQVKTNWIESLQQEVVKRDEATIALQRELQVKTSWIESLQQEVVKRDEAAAALQREIQVKTKWIESLTAEVRKRDEATLALLEQLNASGRPSSDGEETDG